MAKRGDELSGGIAERNLNDPTIIRPHSLISKAGCALPGTPLAVSLKGL